jgi:hypothetical protein
MSSTKLVDGMGAVLGRRGFWLAIGGSPDGGAGAESQEGVGAGGA